MTPETEKAYRAWRMAVEKEGERSLREGSRPIHYTTQEKRDARIRRLKERYEKLLCAEKGVPYFAD